MYVFNLYRIREKFYESENLLILSSCIAAYASSSKRQSRPWRSMAWVIAEIVACAAKLVGIIKIVAICEWHGPKSPYVPWNSSSNKLLWLAATQSTIRYSLSEKVVPSNPEIYYRIQPTTKCRQKCLWPVRPLVNNSHSMPRREYRRHGIESGAAQGSQCIRGRVAQMSLSCINSTKKHIRNAAWGDNVVIISAAMLLWKWKVSHGPWRHL